MDNLQTMGMVNAMRTGDARVDMYVLLLWPLLKTNSKRTRLTACCLAPRIIAMLIPFVIRLVWFCQEVWIRLHCQILEEALGKVE
jgi:hypothetical protein